MMNDPLLPPPPPPVSSRTTPKKSRRPGVANSAKILATGLATTATLGLTAGYALASKTEANQAPVNTGTPNVPSIVTPSVPATTETVPPSVNNNSVATPEVTNPPVVEIPVPTVAPAQPGNNWGNGGNNQQSSGSR